MSPDQELALYKLIAKLVEKDFTEEFARNYERILQVTRKHPFQPNNEIRNVLGHISNACNTIRTGQSHAEHRTGNPVEDAEAEIERARRHVYIARHGTLTILLCTLEHNIEARLDRAELDYRQRFPDYHKKLAGIEKDHKSLPEAPEDIRGPKAKICEDNAEYKRICDRLEFLVIRANQLLKDINDTCPFRWSLFAKYPRIRRIMNHTFTIRLATGLIVAGTVYFIVNYVVPDPVDAWLAKQGEAIWGVLVRIFSFF